MNQLSVISCGNGDTVFLEAHGALILTDVNYRQAAQNGGDDENLDFGPHIRQACAQKDHHLDIFVLTHPDKDHLGGYADLFHTGPPETWNPNPRYSQPKILVDALWCSPYAINPNYVTDEAKPLIDEIDRRNQLRGTLDGKKAGNRLFVFEAGANGNVTNEIYCNVFAPTLTEATIPKKKAGEENEPSSNPSSLVIEWTVKVEGTPNYILLGGDSTVEIWERIYRDINSGKRLPQWHVLLAPHHCSRRSMGRRDPETKIFEWSEEAITALSNKVDRGLVVASSKAVKRDTDDPPSWNAKQKYLKILANGEQPAEDDKRRFHCTGEAGKKGTCGHVIISLTKNGPVRRTSSAKTTQGDSAITAGGGYG
ncbi:MAG: hypothetical protein AAF449_15845 [Myxococcota bacterium]